MWMVIPVWIGYNHYTGKQEALLGSSIMTTTSFLDCYVEGTVDGDVSYRRMYNLHLNLR